MDSLNDVSAELIPGQLFTDQWISIANRFNSALYQALTFFRGQDEYLKLCAGGSDFGVEINALPTEGHKNLCRILCATVEMNVVPHPQLIAEVANHGDMMLPIGGGDQVAEIEEVLAIESTPAGIRNYANSLSAYYRKAIQIKRLNDRLAGFLNGTNVKGAEYPPPTPQKLKGPMILHTQGLRIRVQP